PPSSPLALHDALPISRAELVPECRFGPGAMPAETGRVHGTQIPIDHIIVMMQENRSFDRYFGRLHDQGQPRVRPPRPNSSNPDPDRKSTRLNSSHRTI